MAEQSFKNMVLVITFVYILIVHEQIQQFETSIKNLFSNLGFGLNFYSLVHKTYEFVDKFLGKDLGFTFRNNFPMYKIHNIDEIVINWLFLFQNFHVQVLPEMFNKNADFLLLGLTIPLLLFIINYHLESYFFQDLFRVECGVQVLLFK